MISLRRSFCMISLLGCLLVCAPGVKAQGLFDLFGGSGSSSKTNVQFVEGDKDADDEILLIKLRGVIQEKDTDDREGFPFDMRKDMMGTLKKDIKLAQDRPNVKAVLVEIDSPGGEVTASDIIHHELSRLKGAKKPLVALIGSMGASGAYYAACAADAIMAHPTSIIGSIGVIMHTANLEKLAAMVGYKDIVLKSDKSPRKDIMNPFREMTPEERTMLLSLLNNVHDRFISIVAAGRKKTAAEITPRADGSIFTSDQAKEKGLIDGIGYREDAIEKAKALAGLKTAKLVSRKTKKGLSELFSQFAELNSGAPTFMSRIEQLLENSSTPSVRYQLELPTR